jgi:glutathione S-transferase
MYTLYFSPGSAAMLPHLALLEIGAPCRLERLNLEKGEQRSPEYLKLNPQGVVPTLLIDGRPLTESAAILAALADRHPQAKLAPPPGTAQRDSWYQWLIFNNTLAATFRYWFYPGDLGMQEPTAAVRDAIRLKIEKAWDRFNAHLAASGPYLLGEEFSGVDLYLTMLMRWSRRMPRPATEWPALKALADRVRARASWKKLYEVEGLTEWY